MNITSPMSNARFMISSGPDWPSIPFQTDGTGTHTWNWEVKWGGFTKSASANTPSNQWEAKLVVTNYGGTLTVRAQANGETAILSVRIYGVNPSAAEVVQFLASKPGSAGFDKILQHETGYRHFNVAGEPIKSFDNGYGMCQLTTPVPSFEQTWNWKSNVEGGLALFADKRRAAIAYLSQSNRSYTEDELKYEAVSRWNGGSYHEWDTQAGTWVRHSNIVCDSATGNIGWDMNDADNTGKTEAQLHRRDSASYGKGRPGPNEHWRYSGVCYADRILG